MLEKLPLKEKTAIELKYLSNTHIEISEKLDVPKDTIDGWFKEAGKLKPDYHEFVKRMNKKRQEEAVKQFVESDENILTITTNIMRRVGKDLGDGRLDVGVADFKKAWEIQRVTQGLTTDVKRQDIYDQKALDEDARKIRGIIDDASKEKDKESEKKNEQSS